MPSLDPLLEPTPPADFAVPAAAPATAAAPVKLCLLLLFNHRFDANLPKLDRLYRDRFEHIRYLVPFYRGDRPDVIPVFHSSYQFQGFFEKAWEHLRNEGFTHFLVCADDMVLNPALTSRNLLEKIPLGINEGYIKDLDSLADRSLAWFPTASALVAVAGTNGVHWQKELPSDEAAAANLRAKGFPPRRLGWQQFRGRLRMKGVFQFFFYLVLRLLKRRREAGTDPLGLPYPLLAGNADIMVIPAACMEKFSFYCAVFAAMGVFVEVAAPTALVLACPRVKVLKDLRWTTRDYYLGCAGPKEYDAYCQGYDYDLAKLLAGFEENVLLLHPIKLSQWRFPGEASSGEARTA